MEINPDFVIEVLGKRVQHHSKNVIKEINQVV